jgi:hypothetical protein
MTPRGRWQQLAASHSSGDRARRSRLPALSAVVLALVLAIGGPAAASATSSDGNRNAGWQSGNWAGYIVDDGPYTSVSGQWTVPSVSSSRTGFSAVWLGIDGVTNGHLIQVGTEQDSYFGRTEYSAWWEILPAPAVRINSFRVRPGDHITATIKKVSSTKWQISMSNAGHGSFTTTRTYSGKGTSAEWILEAPLVNFQQSTLARHAPVIFDHVKANGRNPQLTIDQSGTLIQFHRRAAATSSPDKERDGFTVRRL